MFAQENDQENVLNLCCYLSKEVATTVYILFDTDIAEIQFHVSDLHSVYLAKI